MYRPTVFLVVMHHCYCGMTDSYSRWLLIQWRTCHFLVTAQDNFASAIVYVRAVCISSVCIVPTAITGDSNWDELVERHGKAALSGHFLLLQQLALRKHCQHESLGMFFHI